VATESCSPIYPIAVIWAPIVLDLGVSSDWGLAVKIQLERSGRSLELPASPRIKTPIFVNDPVYRFVRVSAFSPDHESGPEKIIHPVKDVFADDS
jgi:hypothetical protein